MKKNKILILAFFVCACATSPSRESNNLSTAAFDAIQRGSDVKNVSTLLGKPNEIRENPKDPSVDWWVYDDSDQAQRASILIDRAHQTVISIMVIPRQTEAEAKLDFLIKNKFSALSFAEYPLQRCSRDYLPLETFFIDSKLGVLVVANRFTHEVESFSRVSPEAARKLADDIRTCRR